MNDIYDDNKHIKEERLDIQTTDDLTSLSPLNEETGLIPFVFQVGNIQPAWILYPYNICLPNPVHNGTLCICASFVP